MAGPVGKFRAGKGARIQSNGTNLNHAKWDVDDKADRLDTTNFESAGVGQSTTGVEVCEYNCSGLWDAHVNAYDSPPGLFPTDNSANLKLFENVSDAVFWLFPQACIFSAKNGAAVRELVTFAWSGESNGSFSRPTGSI